MYMLPWPSDVSCGMMSQIIMCRKNRLFGGECVTTPGLQDESRSYMNSWCMHVYVDMTEYFFERTVVFLLKICGSKWILSREVVPHDI